MKFYKRLFHPKILAYFLAIDEKRYNYNSMICKKADIISANGNNIRNILEGAKVIRTEKKKGKRIRYVLLTKRGNSVNEHLLKIKEVLNNGR